MRIECKWQQVSGSVDEKLPYLYLNCVEAMPEDYIIIIIDGGGFRAGSITWLKEAAKSNKYNEAGVMKSILVFSLAEFIAWANKNLR
ncbi:MAG: PD-(D/E)XK nuclease superfamily protein [Nitrospirota bacterium]